MDKWVEEEVYSLKISGRQQEQEAGGEADTRPLTVDHLQVPPDQHSTACCPLLTMTIDLSDIRQAFLYITLYFNHSDAPDRSITLQH